MLRTNPKQAGIEILVALSPFQVTQSGERSNPKQAGIGILIALSPFQVTQSGEKI